jgi:hypothetical protein
MQALDYDGPAELLSRHGELLGRVKVHLERRPPEGPHLGSWRGTVLAEAGTVLGPKVEVGDVTIRLPDGRTARAVLTERPLGPARSAALIGSGPPPF